MAVYTKLHIHQLEELLKLYDIGSLITYNGITEGIENSNFFIETTQGKFILTIFENRVNKKEIPFFLGIMSYLSQKRFLCPKPIIDLKNNYIHELSGKPCIIVNFLEGKSKTNINPEDCFKVGSYMGYMHNQSKDFSLERQNSLSISGWKELIEKCDISISENSLANFGQNLIGEIKETFNYCEKNWPTYLPKGFIHADMFPDNVFFLNNSISGIIDFYFGCTDILAYDVAVAVNAWCFNDENVFNKDRYNSLISGYNSQRELSKDEILHLPLLSKAASMRFLLTRLYDWVNTPDNADVIPKDPYEYIVKLRYFKETLRKNNNE